MAGIAKPYNEAREAKYILNQYAGHTGSTGAIFNGIINETYPNVLYFSTATHYIDLTFEEEVSLWRYTAHSGEVNHRNPLIVKKYNESTSSFDDYTITQATIEAGVIKWTKFIERLPKGRYRFYADTSKSNGLTGIRSEAEWFIESTTINKTLILLNNEYKKWNEVSKDTSPTPLIPVMTSNTMPNGKVSASSASTNDLYTSWRAFDGILGDYGWNTVAGVTAGWLLYEFSEPTKINMYSVGAGSQINQMPKDWTLEGTNDDNWEILDTVNNQSWTVKEIKEFTLNEEYVFKKYRINITSINGGSYINISEMQLYYLNHSDELSSWKSISSTLPTQEQFSAEGMNSLSPILDRRVETLEPLPMTEDSNQMESGKLFSKTLNLKKYVDIRSVKVDVK